MSDVTVLKRQRTTCKNKLSALLVYANAVNDKTTLSQLSVRYEQAIKLYENIEGIESRLQEVSETEEVDPSIDDIYYTLVATLKTHIRALELKESTPHHSHNTTSEKHNISAHNVGVKLPKLCIPPFSGDYSEWPSFFDMFSTTIHESDLSGVEKLQYLKSLLRGDAASLLRHIQITEANYIGALNKLRERYDNKKFIINSFIKSFFEQSSVHNQNVVNLRKLRDHSDEVLRGMTALGTQAESRDPWIIYILTQKLDESSKLAWADHSASNNTPTVPDFFAFLDKRIGIFESLVAANKQKPSVRGHVAIRDTSSQNAFEKKTNYSKFTCAVCAEKSHSFMECNEFQSMPATKRKEFIQNANRCFNCLSANHPVSHCPSKRRCQKCSKKHHTLLHFAESSGCESSSSSGTNQSEMPNVTSAVACISTEEKSPLVTILPTARIEVFSRSGKSQTCRALLDSGSQMSFITEECVQKLALRKTNSRVIVNGVGEMSLGPTKGKVKLLLKTKKGDQYRIDALILQRITSAIPTINLALESNKLPEGIELADPGFWRRGSIDILVGADHFFNCLKPGKKLIRGSKLILQETIFGWVASGRADETHNDQAIAMLATQEPFLIDVDKTIRRFWEVESVGENQMKLTEEEQLCESKFLTTTRIDDDGRFVVRLPFKQSPDKIGLTLAAAIKRLQGIERRFHRDSEFKLLYGKFMKEYIELKHMEEIPPNQIAKESCYLPHHGVMRADSSTTKLRVVFDGSAKSSTGISLNECLAAGPVVQPSLFSIILRFREYPIVFSSDAEKMYRQVKLNKPDTDYQRIVWRANVSEPIKHYRLLTVTYGLTSASYLATRVLKKIGDDYAEGEPRVSKLIKNCFYVDDLMAGAHSEEEARALIQGLVNLLGSHGFTLRKWKANKRAVLSGISNDLLDETSKPIDDISHQESVKVLGLSWNPNEDTFVFSSNISFGGENLTKRKVLSLAGKLFDPLGWLAPATIMMKIFLQQLWCNNFDWDEGLPTELVEQWEKICASFNQANQLTLPRFVGTLQGAKVDVHAFCDASMKAYSAVIYFRIIDEKHRASVQLISAKTKVAPIKTLSLPRLELCGAVLLAKLAKAIKEETSVSISSFTYWTDSKIVLDWLAGHPRRWSTFVGNRTSEVLATSDREQWKHVLSEDNPADVASRGITLPQLQSHQLWWRGPAWLSKSEEFWPSQSKTYETAEEESKKLYIFHAYVENKWLDEFMSRFSSYNKAIKVLCYVRRFIEASRQPTLFHRECKLLTTIEFSRANDILCTYEQQKYYSEDIAAIKSTGEVHKNSSLKSLNPFLDKFGLLRVGGRLHHSLAPYSMKHPIILHPKSLLSWLIIRDEHELNKHAGATLLMSLIKQRYWIPRAKVTTVKRVIDQCTVCTRHKAELRCQLMGNLPLPRVDLERPFFNTGIDFAGPFSTHLVKGRGNQKIYKVYVSIFVCMAVKAIHLELVTDLTSDAFLAALKRFVSRRGGCRRIFTDNGTNFVGANTKLIQSFDRLMKNSNKCSNFLCTNSIEWTFIPPYSPHFGGLWESGVKSFKFHLKRVTGRAILTIEEMTTLLAEIESILNHRPLCRSSDAEIDFLTPAHFLYGYPPSMLPVLDEVFEITSCTDRWRTVRNMSHHFWDRWYNEYLTQLQSRNKWKENRRDLQTNDVVLIQDKGLPVSHWLMGKVIDIHPGEDHKVRVVTLKTRHGEIKRSIHRLCLLPLN